MFCPNCGQKVKNSDNFCRYCGKILAEENEAEKILKTGEINSTKKEKHEVKPKINDNEEEIVLYVIEKHWMGLFLPIILSPLFLMTFWKLYVGSNNMFTALLSLSILAPLIYPVLKQFSEKIIITNKYMHIKHGIFDIEEIDIPIENLNEIYIKQSAIGEFLNYGYMGFISPSTESECYIRFIKNPEELKYFINNPYEYIKDAIEEDPFLSLVHSIEEESL